MAELLGKSTTMLQMFYMLVQTENVFDPVSGFMRSDSKMANGVSLFGLTGNMTNTMRAMPGRPASACRMMCKA